MSTVVGALREAGRVLAMLVGGGGEPDTTDDPSPHRGPLWISVQVLTVAAALAVFVALHALIGGPADAGGPASALAWFLPGFLLALPLAVHWFARPPRRLLGLLAGVAAAAAVAVLLAPLVTTPMTFWSGLLTLTPAALAAAVVFGLVSPVGPSPVAGRPPSRNELA